MTGRARAAGRALALILLLLAFDGLVRPMVREIVISKSRRTLTVYGENGEVLRSFPIGLGRSPAGHKQREGDERTPEGEYTVCFKNTQSRFHLSLGVSYPNPADARRGIADGMITEAEYEAIVDAHRRGTVPPWKTALGGEIFIHGGLDRHDSTAGCVAIHDRHIEEIFPLVELGTPVRIEP